MGGYGVLRVRGEQGHSSVFVCNCPEQHLQWYNQELLPVLHCRFWRHLYRNLVFPSRQSHGPLSMERGAQFAVHEPGRWFRILRLGRS
ncbi:hypothetical protein AG1IA_10251 [Rhizoctonia solani AG-1 IA]|uniref:Uncharacterized protein n=1 Tax=Thanatephorus cucumeris (strain AG1-IA) TaxID=983506 RepID=L8WH63_THACA|nr:hypothetical protein AG1IA_10251 [Rhizoctonia solani AG-1 IA]